MHETRIVFEKAFKAGLIDGVDLSTITSLNHPIFSKEKTCLDTLGGLLGFSGFILFTLVISFVNAARKGFEVGWRNNILLIFAFITVVLALIILYKVLNYFPSMTFEMDITGKRYKDYDSKASALNNYFNSQGPNLVIIHNKYIELWLEKKLSKISSPEKYDNKLKLLKLKGTRAFVFDFYRMRTAYTQRNYIRTPYLKKLVDPRYIISYKDFEITIK